MYEAFYGLREKPFSIIPDPALIYWGKNHKLAFGMLEFGVMNNAGFTVITGEIGAGKTTLLRYLLAKLDASVNVGLISNTPQGRDELLQWVLMSLNQSFDGSYSALFFRFQQYLRAEYASGRRTILIIDEAQNLTPKQMKTLITRAGPGTKIICMGNLAQIDTPYLTEGSSGLTYAVDKFKGWPHGGHITLARGERSRLADFASEVL